MIAYLRKSTNKIQNIEEKNSKKNIIFNRNYTIIILASSAGIKEFFEMHSHQ